MKKFLLLITLLCCFNLKAQDWKFILTSTIQENEKGLAGATVSLFNGSTLVQQTTSAADGFFKLEIPPNGDYKVVITKDGHVTKRAEVSTFGVPADKNKDNFKNALRIESFTLFKPLPGIDYSVLDQPLLKIGYHADKQEFKDDEAY
ncbi:MAG: carboxypeptidase-like regulatory domain-containing protein, partial [Bacteroidia bacterium]